MPFRDRAQAGRWLALGLEHLRGTDAVVIGLPRGGVPVAYEVARALGAPLDVIVVRKLGVPFQPEVAVGAVGEDGALEVNADVLRTARVDEHELAAIAARERAEVADQVRCLRGARPRVPLDGRTVVIVDDGIATGATARAACDVARARGAARVVLAVPVAAPSAVQELSHVADEVVCLESPTRFSAVGQFYSDFTQTTDDQVTALLGRAAARPPEAQTASVEDRPADDPPDPDAQQPVDTDVTVPTPDAQLAGRLTLPPDPHGIVVFAHGSGSSRHSPRNRYVAAVLNDAGHGTLLLDLLTAYEEVDRGNVFDIELLAGRLIDTIGWLRDRPATAQLPIGLFGASTGAGAALWAAAEPGSDIAAVVSRGGRPDLAAPRLGLVRAPTLLIVGSLDTTVIQLNQAAAGLMGCERQIAIVPGATHLFEEPGTLQTAAGLASDWFSRYLVSR